MLVGIKMLTAELHGRTDAAADFLNVLGNSKRLSILQHLLKGEMPVNAMAEEVGLSQSALSQHLAKLRSHGLVATRRDRQMIYYSCDLPAVRQTLETLADIFI